MTRWRAQVRLPHKNTLEQDAVQNTFHFNGLDDPEDGATTILGLLKNFYDEESLSATKKLKDWMGTEINFTGARVKIYDMADPEPRAPILDESLGIAAPTVTGTADFPGEVALCLSYRAEATSGVSQARRQGRLYIGPLRVATQNEVVNEACRPSTTFMADLAKYGQNLAAESPIGAQWCVYSVKDDAMRRITHGFVNNAYDTQRRRGVDPTSRNNWEIEL